MKISKKYITILLLIFATISLSCVYADNSTNLIENESAGTFSQLTEKINAAEDVELDENYFLENNLTIIKSINIDGNGHKIKFNDSDGLKINSSKEISITIKNTTFENLKIKSESNFTPNITFIDCKIDNFNNKLSCDATLKIDVANKNTTGNVTNVIKQLAMEIIGNSTDIEAAQKLASWVGINIKYERKAGFYQSPEETLIRGVGNCCSQTDLFLQMCEAAEINKNHTLYYVHTGSMQFGNRHFFAMIDDLCIDVTNYPNDPWGHCSVKNNKILCITQYPYLPILREYNETITLEIHL